MRKFFSLSVFFLFIFNHAFSQLQVTANNNADSLVFMLAGNGLTFSNATINCPIGASGTFNGSASNIGITTGVLLTTGSVINAVGPNIQSSITTANGVTFNDPDLMAIDPQATNDVCILEFDAVPDCDSIFIKFVFGSDEYPEFVNSLFNDAFGIFVTGPNPSGPAYSGYNMTTLPVTSTPVSINNVNNGTGCPTAGPCVNCSYYVDNCTTGPPSTVEYDGFTQVIFKSLIVTPSQSYHFKYAIADAGDQAYDSGVFFSLNSFACIPISVPDVAEESWVNVSPNPSSGNLFIDFGTKNFGKAEVSFSDLIGQTLYETTIPANGKQAMDVSVFPKGIYFMKLKTDFGIATKKIVIAK